MNKVITKKRVNQIEVGDVVGLIGNWLNFTDEYDERLVTVVAVVQFTVMPYRGTWLTRSIYDIVCSDGNTYAITSDDREYFIFAEEVK
jgi:hypothetical protein